MSSVHVARAMPIERVGHPLPALSQETLPPPGASPAADLQRRLSEVAFDRFYALRAPGRRRLDSAATVAGAVLLTFGATGIGALLLLLR